MEIIHLILLFTAFSACRKTRGNGKLGAVGGVCHCPAPLLRGRTLWQTTTGQRSLGPTTWCFSETHPHQEFYGGEGKGQNIKKMKLIFPNFLNVMLLYNDY